jgi:DNA helicase HerA-like ATPase
MQSDGHTKPAIDKLKEYVLKEIEAKAAPQQKSRYKSIIEDNLKKYAAEIEKLPTKSEDPVKVVRENEISLVDFSVDTDISRQQIVVRDIVKTLLKEAMTLNSDFGAIVAIEEVQYFAPEVQMVKYGENWKDSHDAIVEAISQGGGYNLGFVIMTQRPAYVSKSVISQCNSVVSFRLMSGNDQEAIVNYTEYGSRSLKQYLAGLADHEAFICGIALPCKFPVIVETRVEEYPRKSTKNAKQIFEQMKNKK